MRSLLALSLILSAAAAFGKPLELKTGTAGPGWRYWQLTPSLKEAELAIAIAGKGELLENLVPKGALAAINGGYFDRSYKPTGWVKDSVKEWAKPNRVSKKGGVVALKGQATFIGRLAGVPFTPDFVVQNSPLLVEPGGKVVVKTDDGRRAPRTVACLAGAALSFVVVAPGTAQGPTLKELADLLAQDEKDGGFGCDAALNLDGGPSTGAWLADELKEKSPLPLVPIGYGIVIKPKK